MAIVGHGIDVVEVSRVAAMLRDHGDQFLTRCFSADERAYALAQPRRTAEHLAARFAAKEATLKALRTGLTAGIAWTDIAVQRLADGSPRLVVAGAAAAVAARLGVRAWWVSLSHTERSAMASVIAVDDRG